MIYENIHTRPLTGADAENFFLLIELNRERLEDFFAGTVEKNKSFAGTRAFIAEATEKSKNKIYFPFVIVDTVTENLIGYIDIKSIDWNISKAELGFFIDEKYEGNGIVSKAVSEIVEHCFETLKMKKLFLRTHEKNMGSRRIAEKNGFVVEGIIRSDYKTTSGDIVDLMYYGLLMSEYDNRKRMTPEKSVSSQ